MLYRTVKTDIWADPWFQDLHPQAKCLFLYLFTNSGVSACGAMEVSLSRIAFETKIPAKRIAVELEAFGEKILWLPDHNLIVVRNFYRHQRSQSSENFTKAARKAMADLPEAAKTWIGGVYPELSDTHPQPIPNPSPTLGDKEEATAKALANADALAEASEKDPPPPRDDPPEFVEFWKRYPSGGMSRPKALQSWKKVRREHDAIMAGLEAWHRSERWQKGMVKAADIWLRDRMWENPPPPPRPATNANGQRVYSPAELMRLANGENLEPPGDDAAALDARFRLVN